MTTMQTFQVPRADNVDLVFDGVLLAEINSHDGRRPRWTELRIYRTTDGRYVTERIGRTSVEGEHDRVFTNVYENPADIRQGFLRPRPGQRDVWYMNDLAIECIELAAEQDQAVSAALVEPL